MTVDQFIAKWSGSGAAERANKDMFLLELCDVLGVPHPSPATGDRGRDHYVFERDIARPQPSRAPGHSWADHYKEDCFILEAKQGSDEGAAKVGTARRNTPAWRRVMQDAYGQAVGYARGVDRPPPFIITCDIGWCFELNSDQQILERLVALNAERAAEEKRGLVRWLRPEFQNPGHKPRATQVEMTGTEGSAKAAAGPAEALPRRPFPKRPVERIAAVRDWAAAHGGNFTVAEARGAFGGARTKDLEGVLDILCALGIVTRGEGAGGQFCASGPSG